MLKTVSTNFDWYDVPGATAYQIQVDTNTSFITPFVINRNVTPSILRLTSDLPRNRILYWRVRAKAGTAIGPWSAVRSFKAGNPPTTPALLTPADDALVGSYTPLFDWSNSAVPTGTTFARYQIQVSAARNFSTLYLNVSIPGLTNSQYRPVTLLKPKTTYYWRVRAFNTSGEYSSWSPIRSLLTP
jgi:hypothetical protein